MASLSSTAAALLSSSTAAAGWSNSSSSTGAAAAAAISVWSAPNGLVAYAVICFIGFVLFTAMLVWYYARPKLPPMVGVLVFLAWSDNHTTQQQEQRETKGRRKAERGRNEG
jgi:hypothetical protein